MRGFIIFLVVALGLTGVLGGGYFGVAAFIREQNKPRWKYSEVEQGELILSVNATGDVRPVLRVTVGAVVSGPITELNVDFNDHVKKDQVLAKIDPRLFESTVLRDRATLETRQAEVKRAEARLQQAINEEKRSERLAARNVSLISETELDEARFSRMAAEADVGVAKANVQQAQATLENSEANLEYTNITSPVDGIVIDRLIDEGQSLAAQFQAPELFVVAPDMEKRMHIFASIDEADIGLIRQAKEKRSPVNFTVDAYEDLVFEDEVTIHEVRLSSAEEANVVTYPVVVETPNPDMKLLPGMTANLSFQIERKEDIVKIPNAALRFYPPNREKVHPDDRGILDGVDQATEESKESDLGSRSADERVAISLSSKNRHVWKFDGEFLRAVPVEVGISDSRYTELVSGELDVGAKLVTGEKPR